MWALGVGLMPLFRHIYFLGEGVVGFMPLFRCIYFYIYFYLFFFYFFFFAFLVGGWV